MSEPNHKFSCLFSIVKSTFLFVVLCFLFISPLITTSVASDSLDGKDFIPKLSVSPTPTVAPDDLESWANYFALQSLPDNTEIGIVFCTRYDDNLSNVLVTMQMDVMSNRKRYVISCAEFIINFCKEISTRDDVNKVTILCSGPFIDSYGNEVIDTGVRVEYSIETLQKINYEYFTNSLYSSPTEIIEAADKYSINHLYLN